MQSSFADVWLWGLSERFHLLIAACSAAFPAYGGGDDRRTSDSHRSLNPFEIRVAFYHTHKRPNQ